MKIVLKNRVAECREKLRIKNWQLARRLGMSRAYVTRLERGQIQPSLKVALRIAKLFNKRVEEVFELVQADGSQSGNPVSEALPSMNLPAAPPSAPEKQHQSAEKQPRKK